MSIVTMDLHKPLIPGGAPTAMRMFLLCRTSRVTIMSVRRMLRATEIEKYGRPNLKAIVFQMLLFGCGSEVSYMSKIPIAIFIMLVQSTTVGL